jgi:hypothetical protein
MSKWIPLLLVVGVALAPACTYRVARAAPCVWQFRGAVTSVNEAMLQVRGKTGEVVKVGIDDRTSYIRNKQPDSRLSLLQGTRVIVDVEILQPGVYRARLVQIFGGARRK